MNIPSEKELVEITNSIDSFIMEMCENHKISPLNITGIFLARLTRLAREVGYTDDYEKLLTSVIVLNSEIQEATKINVH